MRLDSSCKGIEDLVAGLEEGGGSNSSCNVRLLEICYLSSLLTNSIAENFATNLFSPGFSLNCAVAMKMDSIFS